ncbi:MAG: hypothetical protein ACJ8AD_14810 [Gemmatimonadaceae bacterium]
MTRARHVSEKEARAALEAARKREQEEEARVVAVLERTFATEKRRRVLADVMLQRAYDHMWEHRTEACDAICDFLPKHLVTPMLDAWLDDQFEADPAKRSSWYHGRL